MATSEQDREYRGILAFLLSMGFAVMAAHFYFFCYDSLAARGLTHPVADRFLLNLNRTLRLFDNPLLSKGAALLLLGVYALGNKSKKQLTATWAGVVRLGLPGAVFFAAGGLLLRPPGLSPDERNGLYVLTTLTGFLLLLNAISRAGQVIGRGFDEDPFNEENESFLQEEGLLENEYSVNIPTRYTYRGRVRKGWINVVNPFRGGLVLGTPGSGKSDSFVNNYIRQHLRKGFAMYVYDYKFPDLSTVAYNYLRRYQEEYKVKPRFYVINFDDPRRSHRCNPLTPDLMTDILDAQEAARIILLNLNRSWIQKQGDFFVESPINFLTAIIWFLRIHAEPVLDESGNPVLDAAGNPAVRRGRYCTFPHVIEFANRPYEEIFPILLAYREIENLTTPFASALRKGALEQLEGQIASARIPLARLASPALYWVMTGDDFTLDINDPAAPKVLCVGNNPDRQEVYGAALGLYNARLVKLVNRKGRLKSSLIIDELPTIYFRGLDNLIATARSNKVSTLLSLQDFSQMKRDYGEKEATVILNTVGNLFSGQVVGDTAKALSSRFGKIVQRRQSMTFTERDTTTSLSTQLDALIPESKISTLSQGRFVGAVADNFGEVLRQKFFNAQVVIPPDVRAQEGAFEAIPPLPGLAGISAEALVNLLEANAVAVKDDVRRVVASELDRIRRSPELRHLLDGLQTA